MQSWLKNKLPEEGGPNLFPLWSQEPSGGAISGLRLHAALANVSVIG